MGLPLCVSAALSCHAPVFVQRQSFRSLCVPKSRAADLQLLSIVSFLGQDFAVHLKAALEFQILLSQLPTAGIRHRLQRHWVAV